MFPDDYLHPLEIETRDINSGREKSEEVNSRYEEVIKNQDLEIWGGDMEDNEDTNTFRKTNL